MDGDGSQSGHELPRGIRGPVPGNVLNEYEM